MKTARERYQNDGKYHALVSQFVALIRESQFTPSEIREASILASIIDAENKVNVTVNMSYTKELEKSLQMIHNVTSKVQK